MYSHTISNMIVHIDKITFIKQQVLNNYQDTKLIIHTPMQQIRGKRMSDVSLEWRGG